MAIYVYEKSVELCNMILDLRSVFYDDNRYNLQVLLDNYL